MKKALYCAASPGRRLLEGALLILGLLLVFRTVVAEPYAVPTGSMAPTLLGNHRATTCPRCGYTVRVGSRDDGPIERDYFRDAFCPNCGYDRLDLDRQPECRGDHLLVNKALFDLARPQRWEMAVFRCPADPTHRAYVKRVVGLGGESVELVCGKVFINGELARKSLDTFKALRIPFYDHDFAPAPNGWQPRWKAEPEEPNARLEGNQLVLDARNREDYLWLTYHHWQLDEGKDQFVSDEYSYNGVHGHGRNPVHDFMAECDLEVDSGQGVVALRLTDGLDEVLVELPVEAPGAGARLVGAVSAEPGSVYRTASGPVLHAGQKYHLEFAFVDRRATVRVNGHPPFAALDRPGDRASLETRKIVTRPLAVGARGVLTRVSHLRLYRDIYYTDVNHGSHGPVTLRKGEYFVLGDNSPNSEDNRAWNDAAGKPVPVPEANFMGRPFLTHLPSRMVHSEGLGREWEYQTVDWGRIRGLH